MPKYPSPLTETRIREEILNGAAHEPDSYLVIVYLEKSQEHIAEEIDEIPEEHEEHHNTDRDYNEIMYPVAFVEAEKRYHAHHDFRSADNCAAARSGALSYSRRTTYRPRTSRDCPLSNAGKQTAGRK